MEFSDLGESELMEWLQRGTVFKKYTHGRVARDYFHSCRLWVCSDQLRYTNLTMRNRKVRRLTRRLR